MPCFLPLVIHERLREPLIGRLSSEWSHGLVSVSTKERSHSGLLLGSTGVHILGKLVSVEGDVVVTGEVDLQAEDIRNLFMDGELKDSPDAFGGSRKSRVNVILDLVILV